MTSAEAKIRLYELVLENGRTVSPYVSRIRYALPATGWRSARPCAAHSAL
jgi:hypothetical protein